MPRFFFRLCGDLDCEDEEGQELPDTDAAVEEAVRGVRSIMCEQVSKGRLSLKGRIEVRDEAGLILASIAFRDVLAIEG
jgi:hypothetical protein